MYNTSPISPMTFKQKSYWPASRVNHHLDAFDSFCIPRGKKNIPAKMNR